MPIHILNNTSRDVRDPIESFTVRTTHESCGHDPGSRFEDVDTTRFSVKTHDDTSSKDGYKKHQHVEEGSRLEDF